MIDSDLKDLLQRVTVLEQNWKSYGFIFGTVGILIALFLGIRLQNLFRWAEKRAQTKINEAIAESQFAKANKAGDEYPWEDCLGH